MLFLRYGLFVLILLPVFTIIGLKTEQGTAFTLHFIADYFSPGLHYQKLKGCLIDAVVLEDLSLETGTYTFSAKAVTFKIDWPSLMKGHWNPPLFLLKDGLLQSKLRPMDRVHIASTTTPMVFEWTFETIEKKKPLFLQGLLRFSIPADAPWQANITLRTPIPLEKQGIKLEDLYLKVQPLPVRAGTETGPYNNSVIASTPPVIASIPPPSFPRKRESSLDPRVGELPRPTGRGDDKVLALSGGGRIKNQTFTTEGSIDLNKGFETNLKLTSHSIQIYDTDKMSIKASPNVDIHYVDKTLSIQGSLAISEAFILLDNYTFLQASKDVKILDLHQESPSLNIVPTLKIILGDKLHIKSPQLAANLSGTLKITKRSDGLLTAFGRLIIKKGTYHLHGRTQFIRQGSLLFPLGTLLRNPLLDLQLYTRRFSQTDSEENSIYIQGTLQKPLMQIDTKDEYRQSALLSNLGLGDPENDQGDNQQKTFAQTALLLSGQANPVTHILESGFGIEEFKLESRPLQNHLKAQNDTAVVLGRPLSPKLYLQYVQTIMEPLSTLRLKYALTPRLSTSIETNTEGFGGDLTLSIEKD